MNKEPMNIPVEGLWILQSMEQRYDDGRLVYPFGKDAEGRIYYGPDGVMVAAIQKGGRKPFTTGKQWTASVEEKAKAYDSYLSYCGRWTISGDQVTHHIEISLFPDWIGNRQVRTVKIEDGVLYITARLENATPEARTAFLIFHRASTDKPAATKDGGWTTVASLAELSQGETMAVDVKGEIVCLYNLGGRVFATQDLCSHAEASLAEGYIEGDCIECPLHQAKFNIATGKVQSAPATEDLRVYPVEVHGDEIRVYASASQT